MFLGRAGGRAAQATERPGRAVSQESTTPNLELVRRIVEALNRRDFEGAVADYGQDAVLDLSPIGLEVAEGRDAVRDVFQEWLAAYEDFEQVIEEVRELDHGVTFAVLVAYGRLRDSASWLELRYVSVATWANGLIERHTNYIDIDQARAAAERLAQERG